MIIIIAFQEEIGTSFGKAFRDEFGEDIIEIIHQINVNRGGET